jgi:[ribosomal protein S5]-alanine N-acetyltransferase
MTEIPEKPWFPLETERLILREFRESDLDDVHAYGSDPEVSLYMDWGPNTLEMSREFLGRQIGWQMEWPRNSVSLAIELKTTHEVIGSIRLAVTDVANRNAEFGYSIRRRSWRQGIATEATRMLVGIAFDRLGMHRVFATCDVRNNGSWGVMEKLGMRREGLMRQNIMGRDGWRDTYIHAILADEWWARL